jgi:hypothetical protein
MTETEDSDFGRELIASMQEAAAIVRGDKDAVRVRIPPGGIEVRWAARRSKSLPSGAARRIRKLQSLPPSTRGHSE